jgi:hypothetical protein
MFEGSVNLSPRLAKCLLLRTNFLISSFLFIRGEKIPRCIRDWPLDVYEYCPSNAEIQVHNAAPNPASEPHDPAMYPS